MIVSLTGNSTLTVEVAGRRGSDLSFVAHGGLPIVPTVIIGRNAFGAHRDGTLPSRLFDEAFAMISEEAGDSELLVCCSPTHDAIWCENDIRSQPTVSAVRNAVERLYRSTMSARSRADRAKMKVPEEDATPAILVQKFPARTGRLLSRHAVTGRPTTETNWTNNINNVLPEHIGECIALAKHAELLLRKPIQMTLDTANPAIASVGPSVMTTEARLVALFDLLERGAINEETLVKQIYPSMFGHLQSYELHPGPRVVNGLPASPGQVLGRVCLSKFKREKPREDLLPPVLFLVNAIHEDVHDIAAASASVGSVGGLTSELAVVCRGMGKPCVVGTRIEIDKGRREVVLRGGTRIKENAPVFLDGKKGVLAFSDSPDFVPKYYIVRHDIGAREAAFRAIRNVSADKAFRELSIAEQKHIALLKYTLREFGLSSH